MKYLFLPFMLLFVGCASVNSTVNTIKYKEVDRAMPVYFPVSKTPNIDIEKVRRQCERAATKVGLNVQTEEYCKSSPCNVAIAMGANAGTSQKVSSHYNSYTKATYVSSSEETKRLLRIQVFGPDVQNPIWEADLSSTGESDSVLGVAYEMCQAGLRFYPWEITNFRATVRIER